MELNKLYKERLFEQVYKSSNKLNGEFISYQDLTPGENIMEPKNHKVIGTLIRTMPNTDDLSDDEYDNTLVTYSDGEWFPLSEHNPFKYDKDMHLAFIELSEPKDGYDYGIEIYASDDWGLDSKDFLIATTEDEDYDSRTLDEKVDSMFTPNEEAFNNHPIGENDPRNVEINKRKTDEYYKSKSWY